MTAQAERMAGTLVRLVNEAWHTRGGTTGLKMHAARRWTDLPGHEDMLLEAELAHLTDEDADARRRLSTEAVARAERTLFDPEHSGDRTLLAPCGCPTWHIADLGHQEGCDDA